MTTPLVLIAGLLLRAIAILAIVPRTRGSTAKALQLGLHLLDPLRLLFLVDPPSRAALLLAGFSGLARARLAAAATDQGVELLNGARG